ncbi:MAG: glycosyltransferase family 87 protein [Alphaproteobacteria bacterium]
MSRKPAAGAATPVPAAERRMLRGAIGISAVYALAYLAVWMTEFGGVNDFFVFWSAARWLTENGYAPQIYDYEAFRAFQAGLTDQAGAGYRPFAYPPSALIVFAPLGIFALLPALAVFLGTSLVLYVAALAWGARKSRLAVLASPAVLMNAVIGQNGFLTAALLVGGLRLMARHPMVGGALIGILTIKPQLGILVPFALIAARQWAALLGATVSALALFLVSLALGGSEIWLAWLDLLPGFAANTAGNIDTASRLMISPAAALATLGVEARTAQLIQIPITLVVIGVIWRVCRRHGLTSMTVAAVCAGTLLATPFAYFYDLTIAATATVLLAEEALRRGMRGGEAFILLLAWAMPVIAVSRLSISLVAPVALALLFAAIVRRIHAAGDGTGSGG